MIMSWCCWVEDLVGMGDLVKYVAGLPLGATCAVFLYMPRLL